MPKPSVPRLASYNVLWLHLLCIVVISLTPFLWLRDGSSVIGHDTGYAILPVEHFVDRLNTWTHRYGVGADQSFATPGFFIHGFEALAYILAQSNHSLSQRMVFSTYMFGMGISMYVTARQLFPKQKNSLLPLFAAVLYEVNHFVLQAWFIAERPKFLTYIALPLLFLILYKLFAKKITSFQAAFWTAILFFFLNGGGAIPLFGALIIGAFLYAAVSLFLTETLRSDLWMMFRYGLYTLSLSLVLQAYWLLPYIRFVQTSFATEVAKSGGIDGVLAWVASISQDTSYANLLRLQGIQEWYVNPFHTYARYYLSFPPLVIASFFFPLLFLYGLITHEKKDRALICSLSLIALVGMLFMAGTHQPFGAFYAYLLVHVPGFIAFRTPFYKFAPLLWFSFSLLIGYALTMLRDRFVQVKLHSFFATICIGLVLVYHFPFFSSQFFSYGPSRTTKVQIPEYVFAYGKWMNTHDHEFGRTLVYPPISQTTYVDETEWGYWSLSTIFSLLDRHSYAQATAVHSSAENQLIQNVTDLLEEKNPKWIEAAGLLGIDSVVLVKDRRYPSDSKAKTNAVFEYIGANQNLKLIEKFGKWEFYKINSNQGNQFELLHGLASVNTHSYSDLSHVLSASSDQFDGFVESKFKYPNVKASVIRPKCEQCLLELPLAILPPSVLLDAPGMPLYKSRKAAMERERLMERNTTDVVELELKNAVRYLSYMRFVANAHSQTPVRVVAWRDYSTVLHALSDTVERYIDERQDLNKRNEMLQTVQATIALQWDELLTFMRVINDLDESGSYQEVLLLLKRIDARTKKSGYFSTTLDEKKYVVSAVDNLTYEMKLNPKTTAGARDLKRATISAYLENSLIYQGMLSDQIGWNELGSVTLQSQNSSKLLLRDQYNQSIILDQTQSTFDAGRSYASVKLNDEIGCASVSLGTLIPGKYEVNFVAKAPDHSIDIDTFALNRTETKPLLPFWGEHVKLVEGVDAKTTIQFISRGNEEQLVRICALFAVRTPTILVRNFSISRISAPEVVFVAHNPRYVAGADRAIRVVTQNQTAYQIEVGPGENGVLTLFERFDPGWTISDPNLEHIWINGFANGWILPASTSTQTFSVTFAGQSKIMWGWRVTIFASSAVVIGGIYVFIKRITNHT